MTVKILGQLRLVAVQKPKERHVVGRPTSELWPFGHVVNVKFAASVDTLPLNTSLILKATL
jgi:hypothetical protein